MLGVDKLVCTKVFFNVFFSSKNYSEYLIFSSYVLLHFRNNVLNKKLMRNLLKVLVTTSLKFKVCVTI